MGQGEELEGKTRKAPRYHHGRQTQAPEVQSAESESGMGDGPKARKTDGIGEEENSGTANPTNPDIQSNFYISLASGPEDPMLLERLCVYRGFV